jgi:two-component system sensor histidine kinase RegB
VDASLRTLTPTSSERRATSAQSRSESERFAPADSGSPTERTPTAITLTWLLRLRWGFFVAQAITVAVARLVLAVDVPALSLIVVVIVSGLSNSALSLWAARTKTPSELSIGAIFGFDTLLLTALLYFAGGPANPFSVFYLVHVTVAAVALGMRWAALVVVLSVVSYAGLFFSHINVPAMEHAHHSGKAFSIHLQGMWGALTIAASLIAYFVTRVSGALRAREAELRVLQQIASRNEKLASLSTLAAGAAHELGTPLGSIAIAAKELERTIVAAPEEALADARLIREELERCRTIIVRMSASAGQALGELPEQTNAADVVAQLCERLGEGALEKLTIHTSDVTLIVPVQSLVQVLSNLVQNALYASRDTRTTVRLTCSASDNLVSFVVEDRGAGIRSADLERGGEPFFTTKGPGQGMGLGLFLARAFAERQNGSLVISSAGEGKGTCVTLTFPIGNIGAV